MQQRFLVQVKDQQPVFLYLLDPADKALFVNDELIDVDGRQVVDQLHLMPGATVVLTGFDIPHPVPEGAVHVVITVG